MNDDQILLANAYFDDDLDVVGRQRAEADPEVMAEVERLDRLRGELLDSTPPSAATRDAAIAAAMAHFPPAMRVTGSGAPTPNTAPPRRRFDLARPLGIAAALVAIGALGVIVIDNSGNDDADDAGDAGASLSLDTARADDAADEGVEDSAEAGAFAETADAAAATPQMSESMAADDAGDGEAELGADAAEDDASEGAVALEASGDMGEDTADSGGSAVVVLRPSADGAPVIGGGGPLLPTLARVVEFAAELDALRTSDALPPTPNTRCGPPDPDQTSEIIAESDFDTDAGTRRLLVAVDLVDDYVFAVDPDTCEVVVSGPLPRP
jgi:hypothetical protein